MKISIFGLGYVGSVTGASLAELGHEIIGIDKNVKKVNCFNHGVSPVLEKGLNRLLKNNFLAGRLSASNEVNIAVSKTTHSIIAVGTPVNKYNELDLSAVKSCVVSIANSLKELGKKNHTIIIRSTVPPGTTKNLLNLVSEISGLKLGVDFYGGMNPEFLREGNAIADFFDPAIVVIGSSDKISAKKVQDIYHGINSKFIKVTLDEAEIIKYTNNSFHAMKIAFANEIGRVSKKYNIDAKKVMDILCEDKKLNISPSYLKPGFAFGGSCLPKDLKGMCKLAENKNLSIPLIESINQSNRNHIQYIFEEVKKLKVKNIAILGLTFKPNTDDVRESPAVVLASKILKSNYNLLIYDSNVTHGTIEGLNKKYIDSILPDWVKIFTSNVTKIKKKSDLFIITYDDKNFDKIVRGVKKQMIMKLSNKFFTK